MHGLTTVSGAYFHADKPVAPEKPGYFIEDASAQDNAPAEMSLAEALNLPTVTGEAGKKVFAKCIACHTVNAGGANGTGPNLHAIMGKKVGAGAPGFAYSSALTSVGGAWDWETMSAWLKSPRAFANGTKMSFAGLSKIEDRAAVMVYMNENGSSLALPTYEAPAETAEADGEGVGAREDEAESDEAAQAEALEDAAAQENEGGV